MPPPISSAPREPEIAPAPTSRRRTRAPWPSLRTPSRWWLAATILLALLIHLPATPFDPLFLARVLLHEPAEPPPPPAEEEALIPIDLDLLHEPPNPDGDPSATAPAVDPATPPSPAAA
ncbi:MAG: hypothetical protein R3F14_46015, partial [Polyangiaceae bacterium]